MCDNIDLLNKEIDKKELKQINKISEDFILKNKVLKNGLIKDYEQVISTGFYTIPSKFNLYRYQYVREEKEIYGKLYLYKESGEKVLILNCEKLGENKDFWKLSSLEISSDEKFIIFTVDDIGDGLCDIYMKYLFKDEIFKISNPNIKKISHDISIDNSNSKVYYISCDKDNRRSGLYYYDLNTLKHFKVYYEKDRTYNLTIMNSSDRSKMIMIVSSYSSTEIQEVINRETKLILSRRKEVVYSANYYLNKWYVLVNNKDNSYLITLNDNLEVSILINTVKGKEISYFYIKYGFIFIIYLENGKYNLKILELCNNRIIEVVFLDDIFKISFPGLSNMNSFNNILVLEYSTFIKPIKYVLLDLDELKKVDKLTLNDKDLYINKYRVFGYKESKYECIRLNVNDRGLRVTVLYNKEFYGNKRKCILYGYGSYGIILEPGFSKYLPSILDKGYIYCLAHIRGGGENGFNWYNEGKQLNKMNTFTDYIECAEFLIKNNITSPDRLVGMGASAGGLLMGSVINLRPELFNLVVMGVPFVNVMSEMCNDNKPLTTEEYKEWGNPTKKKYFEYMLKYCPYNNIDLHKDYPNLYIYSNLEDSLVSYKVPYNYYKKIREAEVYRNGKKKVYLNIKMKNGHTGSSNHFEQNKDIADIYSVILSLA